MSPSTTVIFVLAVFGASAVEMVEALTIVMAAGVTRGWRPALEGAATAVAVLAVAVGVIGVPLLHYVPLDVLRVVVGAILLNLGLSWLQKAVLRASGHKALHDEDAIFERETARLRAGAAGRPRHDVVGFGVAFKGVLLEGIEVVLVVVGLGTSDHRLGLAAAVAGAAALVVGTAGLIVARQLSAVPENTIKLGVGVMLTSFGTFWVGEGAGVRWPGGDLAIPVLVGVFALATAGTTWWLRAILPAAGAEAGGGAGESGVGRAADPMVGR
jgi:Ca2+/H+ antiporter, TMEM165/GDT1 family